MYDCNKHKSCKKQVLSKTVIRKVENTYSTSHYYFPILILILLHLKNMYIKTFYALLKSMTSKQWKRTTPFFTHKPIFWIVFIIRPFRDIFLTRPATTPTATAAQHPIPDIYGLYITEMTRCSRKIWSKL